MKNLLKIFQSDKPLNLDKIQQFGDNFELREATRSLPRHLVAHGEIETDNGKITDVKTAINQRGNDLEFSTRMGQVPKGVLGLAATEKLNHRYDGKFVTFEADEPNNLDLVYTSRKPIKLDKTGLQGELYIHAKTKVSVDPIVKTLPSYHQQITNIESAMNTAEEIIDGNLRLQERVAPSELRYKPKTLRGGGY
jgi:hypothetical protein